MHQLHDVKQFMQMVFNVFAVLNYLKKIMNEPIKTVQLISHQQKGQLHLHLWKHVNCAAHPTRPLQYQLLSH